MVVAVCYRMPPHLLTVTFTYIPKGVILTMLTAKWPPADHNPFIKLFNPQQFQIFLTMFFVSLARQL